MVGIFHTITTEDVTHWPPGNYKNPLHRKWMVPYCLTWEIITTIFVAGRLYLRGQRGAGKLRSYGLDDLAIAIGWAFSVAFTILGCVSVYQYGVGRHIWDMDPKYYGKGLYAGWLAQLFFILSTGGTKMSVFLFYARLLKGAENTKWIWANRLLMWITAAIWIAGFVTECFMCIPLHTFWTYLYEQESNHRCLNGNALTIATAVLTIATDFWTAALPCALMQVYDLGLTRRQKLALNAVFCLGFVVTGIGGVRTYFLWQIGQDMDISWVGYDLYVTSIAECQISIICTCAPFCRAFFRRYLPDKSSRSSNRRGTSRTSGMHFSTASERADARVAELRKSSSPSILRSIDSNMELDELEESSTGGRTQTYVLAKDEKTGRISMHTRGLP